MSSDLRPEDRFWNPYFAGLDAGPGAAGVVPDHGQGSGSLGCGESGRHCRVVRGRSRATSSSNEFMAQTSADGHGVLDNYFVFEVLGVFLGGVVSAYAAGRLRPQVTKGPRIGVSPAADVRPGRRRDHGLRRAVGPRLHVGPGTLGRRHAVGRQLGLHVRRVRRRLRPGLHHEEAVDMIFPFESLVGCEPRVWAGRGRRDRLLFRLRAGTSRVRPLDQAGRPVLLPRHDRLQGDVQRHRHGDARGGDRRRLGAGRHQPRVASWWSASTFLWPMLVGGLLLGVGFIISGYCPGTSLVAAASGAVDGMLAFVGVVIGSVLFGMAYPDDLGLLPERRPGAGLHLPTAGCSARSRGLCRRRDGHRLLRRRREGGEVRDADVLPPDVRREAADSAPAVCLRLVCGGQCVWGSYCSSCRWGRAKRRPAP